jgi:HipA-like protein
MKFNHKNIIGINVYLENRKTRTFVGQLTKIKTCFIFKYSKKYLYQETAISLGPEFPLTKVEFLSRKMFPSFLDRIPSKENPAYEDYCNLFGINTDESNLFVLLATIGRKGPSSFIFEPLIIEDKFTSESLKLFRKKMKLSTRNFALLFDVSPTVINKIECGHNSGEELLKRFEIYFKFPEIALFEIEKNRELINYDIYNNVKQLLMNF